MQAKIQVVSGPHTGRKTLIPVGQPVPVGRSAAGGVMIADDRALSREHFLVEFDGVTCRLRDLGSRNGTLLNGTRVSESVVQHGDHVLAGETQFAIRIDPEAPATQSDTDQTAAALGSAAPSPEMRYDVTRRILPSENPFRPYQAGINDDDPGVRTEALYAAAWARQPWLLDHCRLAADDPSEKNWDAVRLLAILGQPSDLRRILSVLRTLDLGPRRFQISGFFGHPQVVPYLLEAIQDDDPSIAIAAGAAFTKITGADIELREAEGTEEAEGDNGSAGETPDEGMLPDADAAKAHWHQVEARFETGTRWARGFDVSQALTDDVLGQLDEESRQQAYLRGHYEGTRSATPAALAAFP